MNNSKKAFEDIISSLSAYEIFENEDNICIIVELISKSIPIKVVDFESNKFILFKAICPSCGYDVYDRAAFCSKCGQRLKW